MTLGYPSRGYGRDLAGIMVGSQQDFEWIGFKVAIVSMAIEVCPYTNSLKKSLCVKVDRDFTYRGCWALHVYASQGHRLLTSKEPLSCKSTEISSWSLSDLVSRGRFTPIYTYLHKTQSKLHEEQGFTFAGLVQLRHKMVSFAYLTLASEIPGL